MNAAEVLEALRRRHPTSAFVPELSIDTGDLAAQLAHETDPQGHERPIPVRRIDALMFDGPQRTAIEIKISRADAKRESYYKVQPWKRVCHRFVYVVPAGLLEIPPVYGCGLWWVHDDGRIEVKRKAIVNHYAEELPRNVITNLAYRAAGVKRVG